MISIINICFFDKETTSLFIDEDRNLLIPSTLLFIGSIFPDVGGSNAWPNSYIICYITKISWLKDKFNKCFIKFIFIIINKCFNEQEECNRDRTYSNWFKASGAYHYTIHSERNRSWTYIYWVKASYATVTSYVLITMGFEPILFGSQPNVLATNTMRSDNSEELIPPSLAVRG